MIKRVLFIFHHLRFPNESGGLRSFHIINAFDKFGEPNTDIKLIVPSTDSLNGSRTFISKNISKNFFQRVKIKIIKTPFFNKNNFFSRINFLIIFSLKVLINFINLKKQNIVFLTTYPLPLLIFISFFSRINRSKLIIEVRDLFIHGFEAKYFKKKNLLEKFFLWILYSLEGWCLRSAEIVIPNSDGFINTLIKDYKVSKLKIYSIPLGIDIYEEKNIKIKQNKRLRYIKNEIKSYNNSEITTLVYAGSLDTVHDPTFLKKLAHNIKNNKLPIKLYIFGESKNHEELSNNYECIIAAGLFSKAELHQLLKMFDFGLYFSKNKFPYNAILGNKIFDYSLANIPTLVLEEHSYVNEFAEKNGIGFKVDPNKLDMHQINQLRNNQKTEENLKTFCNKFNSEKMTETIIQLINKYI